LGRPENSLCRALLLLELECLDWRSSLKKAVLLKNKNWILLAEGYRYLF
jgi:hypothetical protein